MAQESLKDVKALLFDVFGTVVNWEKSVSAHLSTKLNEKRIDLSGHDDDFDVKFTKAWRAGYMRRTKEIASGKPGPTNVDELHRELLDELLKDSQWKVLADLDEKDRQEMTLFWHQLDGWSDSSKGLKEVNEMKKKDGSKVIVATLSNGSARLLIDVAKYSDLKFDAVFSGDIIGSYKPNKDMYLGACRLLNLKPEECAMVASHIYDLRAAKSFGLKTIYIPRSTEDTNVPDFAGRESVRPETEGGEVSVVIRRLDELATVLDLS